MNEKNEISALSMAVCGFMAGMDKIFANRVEGWRLSNHGINFEVVKTIRDEYDLLLKIYPVGFPEYIVYCRFDRSGLQDATWSSYKGSFDPRHPIEELAMLQFKDGDGNMVIKSDDKRLKEILARDLDYNCI